MSTHRLLDINVTKNVHSTLQQIGPARNKKKMERASLHVMFYLLFCMFALRKDERKLQYSRSNILGFIHTGYSRMIMRTTELKMQPTTHFRISEKSWPLKLKYPAFFGNG
jgi:hypothetical protein